MKIIIKESRADDLILKYLERYIHPDYGWGSFDYYKSELERYGYLDFEIDDNRAYVYLLNKDEYRSNEPNTLGIHIYYWEKLSDLFGDRWKPVFIDWFETNTNLPVEHLIVLGGNQIQITEGHYKLLLEQKTLAEYINSIKLISSMVESIKIIARSLPHKKNIRENLELLQSLTKQSLSGGKRNISEIEMNKIRRDSKIILDRVASEFGYNDWNSMKNSKNPRTIQ